MGQPFTERRWQEPPAPRGRKGAGVKNYGIASNGLTKTEIGRLGERVAERLGVDREHREKRADGSCIEQAPLDGLRGQYAFEIKTRLTTSTEYRIAMKDYERESKEKWCRRNKKTPAEMMVVHDPGSGKSWGYWRSGLANGNLRKDAGWQYVGQVTEGSR
jgi:hypothetical protein